MMQSNPSIGNPVVEPASELPPSEPSGGGGGGGGVASITEKAKNFGTTISTEVTTQVRGFASHPFIPVTCRSWIFLFSLLSWTITASLPNMGTAQQFQVSVVTADRSSYTAIEPLSSLSLVLDSFIDVRFFFSFGKRDPTHHECTLVQLAVGILIWLFSIFWLVVEVSILKDITLPINTGSSILNKIEILSDSAAAFLAFGSACSVAGVTNVTCDVMNWPAGPTGAECSKLLACNVFMWFTWLVSKKALTPFPFLFPFILLCFRDLPRDLNSILHLNKKAYDRPIEIESTEACFIDRSYIRRNH
jgi:hypothetical protein